MNRGASLVLAAVLGGVVVGGIVWLTRPAPAPVPAAAPVPGTTQPASPGAPGGSGAATQTTSPSNADVPPWADRTGAVNGAAAPGIGAAISLSPADQEKARQRAALRTRIQNLTANGRHPTPAEMDSVLGDLERVEGKPVVAGVDLAALRQNLAAVQKLQRISQQLQAETQRPGGGDKKKIEALLAELRQVQAGMNYNVGKLPPAVPGQ